MLHSDEVRLGLLGRAEEVSRLEAFVRRASTHSNLLLVTGEPGVGKSSLLRGAMTLAEEQQIVVLAATAVEFESHVGLAALHEMLGPHLALISDLEPRHRAALWSCLGRDDGPPPQRSAVASATVALLTRIAADTPVLLVVDDLQWLDRGSAAVLTTVTAGLTGLRVSLLGALRQGEGSFFDYGMMPAQPLRPLGRDDAVKLLESRGVQMSATERERVLAHARGNPLALLQLPIDAASGESWTSRDETLPPSLRGLFAPKIEGLSASTREFLLLAALDTSTELSVVLAAGGPRVTQADVSSAVRHGLVDMDSRVGTLQFTHPLVRSTVVDLAGAAERREAHLRLGRVEHDHVSRRAQHLAHGMVGLDETTAVLLEHSAHDLLRHGDPSGAVAALLRSADLSEEPRHRVRRLAQAAYVGADVTGDLDRVAGLLAEARSGPGDAVETLDSAVAAAYLLLNGDGDVDTAHRLLDEALSSADAEALPPRSWDNALSTLLAICFFAGRPELWEAFTAQLQRRRVVPTALHLSAHTFASPARLGAGVLDELRSEIAELDDEVDVGHVVAIGKAAFYVDELEGCRPALWNVVTRGLAQGSVTSAINAWMLLAFDAFLDGRWNDACGYARHGLGLCEGQGYQLLAWPGRYCLALVAAARGDDEVSAALSDEMLRWAQPRGVRTVMAYARHTAALSALGRSDFESAYRHARAVSPPGVLAPALSHALWLTMDLVEAAVHTGRLTQAAAHVTEMRALDIGALSSRHALMVSGCEAMVATTDEVALFERALALPEVDRWPFELARVQLAYGECLHRLRLDSQARQEFQSAADAFELLQATPWATRARSGLAASSGRRDHGARAGTTLTARELEVATLAASGLSNIKIATRLGMSPRTVSAHVSHILAKLSLGSRAGLRAALAGVDDEQESRVGRS